MIFLIKAFLIGTGVAMALGAVVAYITPPKIEKK